jgi:hypothetical protein
MGKYREGKGRERQGRLSWGLYIALIRSLDLRRRLEAFLGGGIDETNDAQQMATPPPTSAPDIGSLPRAAHLGCGELDLDDEAHGHLQTTLMAPPGSALDEEPLLVEPPSRHKTIDAHDSDSDSDNDSDDEDDGAVSVEKKFKEIIRRLKNNEIDLRDAAQLQQFDNHYGGYLGLKTVGDGDHNTLLHMLVDDAKDKAFDKYQPLVKLLIERHPNLLQEMEDSNEKTPLYLAISKRRGKLVRFICNSYDKIDTILGIPCSHSENCLHIAIRRNVAPELAIFLIERAGEGNLCAKDDKGNTPLHLAVDYVRCTDAQLDIVKALILQCDKAMDERTNPPNSFSPYQYHEHTCAEAKKAAMEKGEETALGLKEGGPAGGISAGQKYKIAAPANGKSFTVPRGQGGPFPGNELETYGLLSRVNSTNVAVKEKYGNAGESYGGFGGAGGYKSAGLVSRSREAPNIGLNIYSSMGKGGSDNVKGLNAKSPVKESRKKDREKEEVKVTEESADKIKDHLKLHCLRTMNHDDAVDFLYGHNQGRSLPS